MGPSDRAILLTGTGAYLYYSVLIHFALLLLIIGIQRYINYKYNKKSKFLIAIGLVISSMRYIFGSYFIIINTYALYKYISPYDHEFFQFYIMNLIEYILAIIFGIIPIWYFYNQYRKSNNIDKINSLKKSVLIFGIPLVVYFCIGYSFVPVFRLGFAEVSNTDYDSIECQNITSNLENADLWRKKRKYCEETYSIPYKKLEGINTRYTSMFLLSIILTSSIGFYIFKEKNDYQGLT